MARRRRRNLASRVRASLRSLLAFLFSNVGVIVLVTGYAIAVYIPRHNTLSSAIPIQPLPAIRLRSSVHLLLSSVFLMVGIVGAFIFQAIEGASEMERIHHMVRERDSTVDYLWQKILALNMFNETEVKLVISSQLQVYQRKVVYAVRRGWDGGRAARQWSFSSAFLYSLTVITTIGYGNLSPRTTWGKLATIFYALLGMPLFLLYLSNVGELLARWFKCLYALVCLCRGCPGFTRRRVVRVRGQMMETSEAESIERPGGWRTQSDVSETTPEYYPHHPRYHQPEYNHRPSNYRIQSTPYAVSTGHFDDRGSHWGSHHPDFRSPCHSPARVANHRRYHAEFRPPYPGPSRPPDPRYAYWERGYLRPVDLGFRGYSEPVYRGDSEASSDFTYITFNAQSITVPISVCVAIMVSYIVFGSMLFGLWEKWDQLDGAYFCFISLSSIGFGDFVPGERIYSQKIETSFIACSVYLMLGMALVAMCFNLMQEQVIHYFAAVKRALKRICRCKR